RAGECERVVLRAHRDVLEEHVDDAVAAERERLVVGGGVVSDDDRAVLRTMDAAEHHIAFEAAAADAPGEPPISRDEHARAGPAVRRTGDLDDRGEQLVTGELARVSHDPLQLVHVNLYTTP